MGYSTCKNPEEQWIIAKGSSVLAFVCLRAAARTVENEAPSMELA
jgi:hypothetical protein